MSIADKIIEKYQNQGTGLADRIIARVQGQSPKAKRLDDANKRAEEARLEAERLNSFSGLAGETFKGVLGMGKQLGKDIIGSTAAVGADVLNVANPLVKPGIVQPIRQVNMFGNEYITPTERERRAKELIGMGEYKKASGEYGTAALDVISTFATPFKGIQLYKGGNLTRGFVQGGTAAAPIVAGYGASGAASEGKDITGIAKDTATGFLAGLAGGGILGASLSKIGSKLAGNPRKDINAFEAEQVINEVDQKIGRATTPQEEEVIMELLSRGAKREEIVANITERDNIQGNSVQRPQQDNGDESFLKAVEERFKASKREKFREATKDEKGRFTGSTKEDNWQQRDELAQSIQNRIDAIKDDSIVGFAAREDLKALQERVASVKSSELTKLSGEAEKIADDYLQSKAEKVRPVIEKEKKIAAVKTIAQESESFSEFQLNLKKRGEEITKLFKSKPAAEEFYQKVTGTRYRVADEDPLLQEARKYNGGVRVYHGTPYNLEGGKLSMKYSGSNTENEKGVLFFTDNKKVAEGYSRLPQSEMEAISERQSQLISDRIEQLQKKYPQKSEQEIQKIARSGGNVIEAQLDIKNPLVIDADGKYYDYKKYSEWIAKAKKDGHDGLIIKNVSETDNNRGLVGTTYAVFDDKKINTDLWKKANGGKYRADFGDRFEQFTGKKITPEQEAKIKALNKRLFGDENVEITAQLMTPYGQRAFGQYKNNVIKILEGQADPTDTFYHEAVHKYLDLFTTLDEQKKIYLEARKLWKTDNLDELEEQIAENFIRYAKENEGVVGTMKVLFDKVINRIKSALKGESQIEALYKDILEGKAVKKDEVKGISKVAQSIEAKSVEKGLTEGFDGLAGYTKITIKEQAEKMAKLMSEDIEKAKSLLDGGELPDGIRGETVIKAMEDYAMKTGDVELALRVANSPLTSETSAHAQAMRLLAERNPESAVAKIQEVKKERQKRFESKGKKVSEAKREVVDDIKKKIKQPVPTEKDWEDFIESIKC